MAILSLTKLSMINKTEYLFLFITACALILLYESKLVNYDWIKNQLKPNYEPRLLLVTGCARSGTTYISQILGRCGLDVSHEFMGKDGCSSWHMTVDADRGPWNMPGANGYRFQHVFHQVRNPLHVISSVSSTEPIESWKYIYQHIPEISPEEPLIHRSAKYWYYWNLAAEKKAEWRYKIEDLENVFDEMSTRLEVFLDKIVLTRVPKTVNSRRSCSQDYTWTELKTLLPQDLFNKIKAMSLRYGYTIED